MLEIYPKVGEGKGYICPVCKCQLSQPHHVVFKLSAVLADIECTCCEEEYYQTLPFEFSQQPKVSFLKKYGKVKYEPVDETGALSLLETIQQEPDVSLEVFKKQSISKALWLNCLFEEEEEVLRVFASSGHFLPEYENFGLVVLIKEELAYLVPAKASEIWKVRLGGSSCRPLNEWIGAELPRFEKLYLPLLNNKRGVDDIFWDKFFKVQPFQKDLSEQPAIVTFFCHPNLFWHSAYWERLLFQLSAKWKLLTLLKPYFERRQLQKFSALAEKLNKVRPSEFYVIGFGQTKAPALFKDQRIEQEGAGVYQKWLPLLAKTEVTIGVFGSKLPARIVSGHSVDLYTGSEEKSLIFPPHTISLNDLPAVKEVYEYVVKILKKEGVAQKQ